MSFAVLGYDEVVLLIYDAIYTLKNLFALSSNLGKLPGATVST